LYLIFLVLKYGGRFRISAYSPGFVGLLDGSYSVHAAPQGGLVRSGAGVSLFWNASKLWSASPGFLIHYFESIYELFLAHKFNLFIIYK